MLKQRKFVIVIAIMTVLASAMALVNIRKLEDPILNLPFYNITFLAPGATSLTLEKEVVADLKDELSEVEDIIETSYHIQDNYFTVKIEAEPNVNVDDKLNELKRTVNSLVFPEYIKKVTVKKVNPLDVNVIQLALFKSDTIFDYKLNAEANKIQNQIEQITGVNHVSLNGERKQIVAINIDHQKLQRAQLPLEIVINKLEDKFSITPTGKLNNDIYALSVKTTYGFENIQDIRDLILRNTQGSILHLKDIASVRLQEEKNNPYYTQYNQYPCIFIAATAKKSADLFYISSEVESLITNYQKNNNRTKLVKLFDQSVSVSDKISDLTWNIIQGILLIFIIIYFILGVRNALIAGIIIPIAIVSAIGLLYFLGFALQQISIAALIISIGLVIDDNIVIIENIHRLLKEGYSKREAITEGVKSIMWPVINSSVTTALVFFPMMNLGGRTGQYIKTLPITVCLCLVTSLIFSIILTPILCHLLINKDSSTGFLSKKLENLNRKYVLLLEKLLFRPKLTAITVILLLVLSGVIFKIVGVTLFPPADKPILLVDIELPEGGAIEETFIEARAAVKKVQKAYPNATYALNIGHGNPKLYYNIFPKRFNENYAQLIVFLDHWENDHFQKVKHHISNLLSDKLTTKVTVNELVNGPPITSPIEIKLLNNDIKALNQDAKEIISLLNKDHNIKDISSPYDYEAFTYHLNVDLAKISKLGISNAAINRNLYLMLSGHEINELQIEGENYPIKVLVNDRSNKNTASDLLHHLSVQSQTTKAYIPYHNFSKLQLSKTINSVEYYNGKQAITITANVVDGINVLEKTEELKNKLNKLKSKKTELVLGGEYKTSKKSFGGVLLVLLIALFAIYAVLVLQFKSYKQPLIVLIAIPLAFIGAVFLLFIFNETFSFLAFIGFTSISGIVINNSMLLVDTFNTIKEIKPTLTEAVVETARQRFLPIVITSITTIFGLLPMIFSGSNLWKPLALTIVGGMISSTLLVLVVIPIVLNQSKKIKNEQQTS